MADILDDSIVNSMLSQRKIRRLESEILDLESQVYSLELEKIQENAAMDVSHKINMLYDTNVNELRSKIEMLRDELTQTGK